MVIRFICWILRAIRFFFFLLLSAFLLAFLLLLVILKKLREFNPASRSVSIKQLMYLYGLFKIILHFLIIARAIFFSAVTLPISSPPFSSLPNFKRVPWRDSIKLVSFFLCLRLPHFYTISFLIVANFLHNRNKLSFYRLTVFSEWLSIVV